MGVFIYFSRLSLIFNLFRTFNVFFVLFCLFKKKRLVFISLNYLNLSNVFLNGTIVHDIFFDFRSQKLSSFTKRCPSLMTGRNLGWVLTPSFSDLRIEQEYLALLNPYQGLPVLWTGKKWYVVQVFNL